jgi:hypothetical protein
MKGNDQVRALQGNAILGFTAQGICHGRTLLPRRPKLAKIVAITSGI